MITGERIRATREDKDILQQELSIATGINVSVLNRIEKGSRQVRDDEIKKIAQTLEVTTDYLLGISDNPHGSPFTGQVDGQFLTFSPEPIKPEEMALLEAYRKAPDHIRQIVDTSLKPYLKTGVDKQHMEILLHKERDKLDVDQKTARVSRNQEAGTTTLDVNLTPAEVAKMLGNRQPKRTTWWKMDDKDKKIYLYIDVGGKNNKKKALYKTILPIKDTPPNFVEKLLSTGKIVEDDD
jgi:transcriptional regulator with XRE-family HTH domain